MTTTKMFPGIIAPKIELLVKINIRKAITTSASPPSNHFSKRRISKRLFNTSINACPCQCPCNRTAQIQDEMKCLIKTQKPVCHTPLNNNKQQKINETINDVNNLDLCKISSPYLRPPSSLSSTTSPSPSPSSLMVLTSYQKHSRYCELCRCYERVFRNKI